MAPISLASIRLAINWVNTMGATPLKLATILARVNAYSHATLRLGSTILSI